MRRCLATFVFIGLCQGNFAQYFRLPVLTAARPFFHYKQKMQQTKPLNETKLHYNVQDEFLY